MWVEEYIGYYKDICSEICDSITQHNYNYQPSTYSNHDGKLVSKGRVWMNEVWVRDGDPYYKEIKSAVERTIKLYSTQFELFSVQRMTDFRINKYDEGGYMSKHCDNIHHSHGQQYGFPQLTSLLMLNDNYEGGELEFKNSDENMSLDLDKGDMVTFPSFLEHRVKPVLNGTRISLVGWMLGPKF